MNEINMKYMKCSINKTYYEKNAKNDICFFCRSNEFPVAEISGFNIIAENSEHATHVCLNCLFEKRYAIEKQVEGGYLTKDKILLESDKYKYLKESHDYKNVLYKKEEVLKNIDSSKIIELKHTPSFRVWQGDTWLIHCNDFMTFIGTWFHEDFVKYSPEHDPKKFYSMIDDNCMGDEFYDEQFGPEKSEYAESTFYAFQCLHCNQYRGYCDNA